MALPPTSLTLLLHRAPTPDAMYDSLMAEKCLSSHARANRSEVIAMLSSAIGLIDARNAAQPGMVGPSSIDEIARELLDSPYLNSRGTQMGDGRGNNDNAMTKRWWQFWK